MFLSVFKLEVGFRPIGLKWTDILLYLHWLLNLNISWFHRCQTEKVC